MHGSIVVDHIVPCGITPTDLHTRTQKSIVKSVVLFDSNLKNEYLTHHRI